MHYIKYLNELRLNDLPLAGGKGANLGELFQAGLPVPDGFVVTTDGYNQFLADNQLDVKLQRVLGSIHVDDLASFESAAKQINELFKAGQISQVMAEEISLAYHILSQDNGSPCAVAVRSSATAEDLPDLSFAGQQDTYLNIIGDEALLDAVLRCWASLWTARAIAYRTRNNISHAGISLAVIVQRMVQSTASGVLFTANPLSSRRCETVIDAIFGLGEALVSGQVEPDHYVVDHASQNILSKTLGKKSISIQSCSEGGTETLERTESNRQALSDEQILHLTRLGQQAVAHFGSPQDIEWAWADEKMYLLQSRPITSLYPVPEGSSPEPLEVFLSFGVWQGMLDPITPLGQDIYRTFASGLGELFQANIEPETQRYLCPAGERLFVNITGLMHNSKGQKFLNVFLAAIDPVCGEISQKLMTSSQFSTHNGIGFKNISRLFAGIFPIFKNVIFNFSFPRRARVRFQSNMQKEIKKVQDRCNGITNLAEMAGMILDGTGDMVKNLIPPLIASIASGQGIPVQILLRLSSHVPDGEHLVMEMTRSLPHNITTEMDLDLWRIVKTILAQPHLAEYISKGDAAGLVTDYHNEKLPPDVQTDIASFLERYGMRGIGEIDLGRVRWKDDPAPVFLALKSHLQIPESQAPDLIFKRGAEIAKRAEDQLSAALGGGLKSIPVRFFARRLRELGGLRESPKYFITQMLDIYRRVFLSLASRLVERGKFSAADDVFYLHLSELKMLEHNPSYDWQELVSRRRSAYQRELRRTRIPRVLLSDGTAYFDSITLDQEESENVIMGNPVSPGMVEGIVHVIFDPQTTQIMAGEILVCPATDPAWTPLFLAAAGLVMEVGGMMTHGSVVAREYGIPAVVGVQLATQRLKTGDTIRLNGSTGQIIILKS